MDKRRLGSEVNLINKLGCVSRGINTLHKFEIDGVNLHRPQIDLLLYLFSRDNEVSLKDLANYMNVSSGAMTQFVDELVDKKILTRQVSLTDRRVAVIKIASDFEPKLQEFINQYAEVLGKIFGKLGESELVKLQELLDKLEYKTEKCDLKGGDKNE